MRADRHGSKHCFLLPFDRLFRLGAQTRQLLRSGIFALFPHGGLVASILAPAAGQSTALAPHRLIDAVLFRK